MTEKYMVRVALFIGIAAGVNYIVMYFLISPKNSWINFCIALLLCAWIWQIWLTCYRDRKNQ